MFSRTRFSGGCTLVTPVIVKMKSAIFCELCALRPGYEAGTVRPPDMYHVQVTVTIDAEQTKVFELLSDHERFVNGPDISCRLVTKGAKDPNGLGAIREVTSAGSVFTEEVTEWDPPRSYSYVVRKLIGPLGRPTPFTHERGWIELSREGGQTRVDWQSQFGMPLPVVGWLIERVVGARLRAAFVTLLARAKAHLERGAPKS
jgi:hypothetical protein